jgi:hypothetical protein
MFEKCCKTSFLVQEHMWKDILVIIKEFVLFMFGISITLVLFFPSFLKPLYEKKKYLEIKIRTIEEDREYRHAKDYITHYQERIKEWKTYGCVSFLLWFLSSFLMVIYSKIKEIISLKIIFCLCFLGYLLYGFYLVKRFLNHYKIEVDRNK